MKIKVTYQLVDYDLLQPTSKLFFFLSCTFLIKKAKIIQNDIYKGNCATYKNERK